MATDHFTFERTPNPGRAHWRVAALAVTSALTLVACAAGASGTPTPTRSTAAAVPSSAPAAPKAGATTPAAPAPVATLDVGIADFTFTPAAITVKVGTAVVWTNKDAVAHAVSLTTGGITPAVLNPTDQFTHVFTTTGTYDYICSIHPFMHGSVTVTN